MILIADSGSTKTDWRLLDNLNVKGQFSTTGFNPFFQSTEEIFNEIEKNLLPQTKISMEEVKEVFYYGAGCSSPSKCEIVSGAISKVFKGARVNVYHDLLGAARATCGREQGIAAILGTGSNSCLFDGKEISEHIPSLGFILGDEGSGADIGKRLLRAFLYKEFPGELESRFVTRFNISKDDVLEDVYRKPLPNRFLSSFSKFAFQNIDHPLISNIVADSFREFLNRHISKYSNYRKLPFNVVGSVGFYYSNILRRVCEEKGVNLNRILETPIAGLALYHLENE